MLNLDCNGDRIYVEDEEGWKLGKVTSRFDLSNSIIVITILNLKKEEQELYLDINFNWYIYYEKMTDKFIVSKFYDPSDDYLLMYFMKEKTPN